MSALDVIHELTSRHGVVTVAEESATRKDGIVVVVRYVVSGSSGYRAVLPACIRDDCIDGRVAPCEIRTGDRAQHAVAGKTSVSAWLAHSRTHCHGWHEVNARRFAREVLATYGTGRRRGKPHTVGVSTRYSYRDLVPLVSL